MSTLTVFADAADGYFESSSSVYSTARAGTGTLTVDTTFTGLLIGQYFSSPTYGVYQAAVSFDTSALGSGATVSAVALSLFGFSDHTTTDFTVEARLWDWGVSLTTADFVAGANLSGKTRLGTFATSGYTTGAYNTFTEDGTNFQSNVSKTAVTRFLLTSDRTAANTAPTGFEYLQVYSADQTGTTNDPKLVVTYTVPITVTPSTLSLTTSLQTPKAIVSFKIKPAIIALTTARFTPSVTIGLKPQPASKSLILTGFAPTIINPAKVFPPTLSLTLSGKTPSVIVNHRALPATLGLVTATYAPIARVGYKVTPSIITLTLNGQTPAVFLIVPFKTSAIFEAQYADSGIFEAQYADSGIFEAQYADTKTLEVA